jgi:HPt (histidine-containing phosphotransfer) domain-containing protein
MLVNILTRDDVQVDITMLYEVAGDDEAYINTMITTFLQNIPPALEKIENAFAEKDYDALHKAAHYAKSSFSVIKVDDVFTYMQQIEQASKHRTGIDTFPPLIKYIKDKYKIAEQLLLERFAAKA